MRATPGVRFSAILSLVLFIFPALSHAKPNNRPNNLNKDCSQTLMNPLAQNNSILTLNAIRFDRIKTKDILPAFNQGMRAARARFEALRENPEPPTFENTILALGEVGNPLDFVENILGNYASLKTNKEIEDLEKKIDPRSTKFGNEIRFDKKLFARIDAVYQNRAALNLPVDQATLLEKTWRGFSKNGARLGEVEQARLKEISVDLDKLGQDFKNNVLASKKAFKLEITDASQLDGLPADVIAKAAEVGVEEKKPGTWIFTLDQGSYIPFLTFSNVRSLRHRIWEANSKQAAAAPYDNRPIILQLFKLREERARLLGYAHHAEYILEDRMAENLTTVDTFLDRLARAYKPAAEREMQELTAFAGHPLEPWDLDYYSEKLMKEKYSFDSESLRPYFELGAVLDGAFFAAERLYNISFTERTDLPKWDKNVRAFEVRDEHGQLLALYYFDPFARKGKQDGAWNTVFRPAGLFEGENLRPHVINVMNLAEPAQGQPALLTRNNVRTVFHELGHALHVMLTKVRYRSLSGTSVARDFVELPSQINENWALDPAVLARYAYHHQTGEPIPQALLDRVKASENYHAGMIGLRQVMLGKLDLAWHGRDLSSITSPDQVVSYEHAARAPYSVTPLRDSVLSTSFSHIVGGYSAGYFSYKWSDVMACDGYCAFQEEDLATVSKRFKEKILEKGGSEKESVLYRDFRGKDPDPDALLRAEGLLP
jgi:Zn-dependent oligopeptidase